MIIIIFFPILLIVVRRKILTVLEFYFTNGRDCFFFFSFQARTHQLLVQNKELLEHISALVGHLREQERVSGGHVTSQSQIPTPASMQQNAAVSDLSGLGQVTLYRIP